MFSVVQQKRYPTIFGMQAQDIVFIWNHRTVNVSGMENPRSAFFILVVQRARRL
jgi:hypothetical protein